MPNRLAKKSPKKRKASKKYRQRETGLPCDERGTVLSPAELAKADSAEYGRQNGPLGVLKANPQYVDYIEAVVDLMRQGKSNMSIRQIADNLAKHYGYTGRTQPIQLYLLRKHGGMRGIRGEK